MYAFVDDFFFHICIQNSDWKYFRQIFLSSECYLNIKKYANASHSVYESSNITSDV